MTPQRPKSSSTRPKRRAAVKAPAAGAAANGSVKIGEAARLVGVEPYVLRFWETQFPFLRPRHTHFRHRHYDADTLATLKIVKRLLHSEGFTIAGAKKHIRETGLDRLRVESAAGGAATSSASSGANERPAPPTLRRELAAIRDDLMSLRELLAR